MSRTAENDVLHYADEWHMSGYCDLPRPDGKDAP